MGYRLTVWVLQGLFVGFPARRAGAASLSDAGRWSSGLPAGNLTGILLVSSQFNIANRPNDLQADP
jgi:hypothetical protein